MTLTLTVTLNCFMLEIINEKLFFPSQRQQTKTIPFFSTKLITTGKVKQHVFDVSECKKRNGLVGNKVLRVIRGRLVAQIKAHRRLILNELTTNCGYCPIRMYEATIK